jgi:5-methylthioadenosine/S-adenosylhomocysteine deaminase
MKAMVRTAVVPEAAVGGALSAQRRSCWTEENVWVAVDVVRPRIDGDVDALFGFDDESFAYQQAMDRGLRPALGIDLDTAFGSDLFGEMRALFGQQRSAMRYRRFRGEANAPAPILVEAVLETATVNGARAAGLESSIGTLTPGKQADVIMIRANGVAVFPVTNAIGTIVQAVERADVDTVMVAGAIRKRAGSLVGVDVAKLTADVIASRDFLFEASGYRPDLFGPSTVAKAAA